MTSQRRFSLAKESTVPRDAKELRRVSDYNTAANLHIAEAEDRVWPRETTIKLYST